MSSNKNKDNILIIVIISVIFIVVLITKKSNNITKNEVSNINHKEIIEANNDTSKIKNGVVFSKRDNEKENFLFLDFWNNMSKNEYEIIKDSLIKSGKL